MKGKEPMKKEDANQNQPEKVQKVIWRGREHLGRNNGEGLTTRKEKVVRGGKWVKKKRRIGGEWFVHQWARGLGVRKLKKGGVDSNSWEVPSTGGCQGE